MKKKQKQKPEAKRGRKLFDGKNAEIVLQKLEKVFSIGGTDVEACFYAEISPSALYEYQKKNPAFLERKRALKQGPNLKARQEVVKGLDGNPELALKYLERKLPEEFGVKKEAINIVQQNVAGGLAGVLNGSKNPYDDWSDADLEAEFHRRRKLWMTKGKDNEVKSDYTNRILKKEQDNDLGS